MNTSKNLLLACGAALSLLVATPVISTAGAQDLPGGPGKDAFLRACPACHSIEVVTGKRQDRTAWQAVITMMTDYGAEATKEERDDIVSYLATHFGLVKPTRVNSATAAEIEAGLKLTATESQAVVGHRTQHGSFKDWRDLQKIEGVDAKKIEAVRDRISVEAPSPPAPQR